MMTDKLSTDKIRKEMVARFHSLIEKRYTLERLQQMPRIREKGLMSGIEQEDIDRIVALFKEVMYPPVEEREERDKSMEILTDILKSPVKLIHYLPRMPKIIARYGRFWKAIHAGIDVISAYKTSGDIENKTLEYIENELSAMENPTPEDITEDLVLKANSSVSRRESKKMIRKVKYLTSAGQDEKLIKESIAILEEVKAAQTSPEEGRAADFIIGILRRLDRLNADYSKEKLARMIETAEIVETAYLEALLSRD
jgi:ATP phosphoribosyltransferase